MAMSPCKKSTSRVALPPTTEVQVALIGRRQYQATEYRAQKQMDAWRGGNTVANSMYTSGSSTMSGSRGRGRMVGRGEYKDMFSSLPPVTEQSNLIAKSERAVQPRAVTTSVTITQPYTATTRAHRRLVRGDMTPAGLPLRRTSFTPLPLTKHVSPPLQKRPKVFNAPDPYDTRGNAINSRPAFHLTQYLETSLKRGHGQVFDSCWNSRFDCPVGREKGWSPGYFGSTKLDRAATAAAPPSASGAVAPVQGQEPQRKRIAGFKD